MRFDSGATRLLVLALGLQLMGPACATAPGRPLMSVPPPPPAFEASGPDEGWPPRPKDASGVTRVAWTELPDALTDARVEQARRVALADARVRDLLGERFAYIGADNVEAPKGRRARPGEPPAVRVTFFSHTRNQAVEVIAGAERVQSAGATRRVPPEGRDEVDEALGLARRDQRLRGASELRGVGILQPPLPGSPAYGHRVIYVCFLRGEEDLPRFAATVDLTAREVLAAGTLREMEVKP